ncbi:hypothetical protein BDN70DRAFT_146728 [Pholiota conissans]|uniref:Uncharacterized protein n=1 Tax=Pholiota conissans TaxID=109636 RepID=A0A9P5ZDE2_9AGAR|nr:hypothetical protein BDN70DRAFT_146728 [Pholiota conissans]
MWIISDFFLPASKLEVFATNSLAPMRVQKPRFRAYNIRPAVGTTWAVHGQPMIYIERQDCLLDQKVKALSYHTACSTDREGRLISVRIGLGRVQDGHERSRAQAAASKGRVNDWSSVVHLGSIYGDVRTILTSGLCLCPHSTNISIRRGFHEKLTSPLAITRISDQDPAFLRHY